MCRAQSARAPAPQMQVMVDPFVANLVLGGVAGAVSNTVVFPLDLAKTKIQQSTQAAGAGPLSAFDQPWHRSSAPTESERYVQLAVALRIRINSNIWAAREHMHLHAQIRTGLEQLEKLLVNSYHPRARAHSLTV